MKRPKTVLHVQYLRGNVKYVSPVLPADNFVLPSWFTLRRKIVHLMTPCDITYTVDVHVILCMTNQKKSHLAEQAKHLEANKAKEILICLFQQKPKGESRVQELLPYTGYVPL